MATGTEISPHGGAASLFRTPLDGPAEPLSAARWLRGEPRAVALSGAWAGGGLLLSSHPVRVADPGRDPFALLDGPPEAPGAGGEGELVGGGWFGWLGFGLAQELEPVGPPPPRPAPLPRFSLAFHDHVVRCDAAGQWWFEALWSEARAPALRARLECWRRRLAEAPLEPQPYAAEPLRARAPGLGGHRAAVAEAVQRIWQGELSQANICLRLEGRLDGDPLELWVRAAARLRPRYAAYLSAGDHVIASLSPELFLRRRGRRVQSQPIKGTAPDSSPPEALRASVKNRAENVMIVDLMRNDLGRVCAYGSVEAAEICAVQPAAGVWHLVSTVEGRLREDVGDGELLRATFPPGSVTGAPKVQAIKLIHRLEPTAREAYCGAIGFRSPVRGLELSVAIRTFEVRGERLWLGAGGGIVSDSDPGSELHEALEKARGVADAAGLRIAADAPPAHARRSPSRPPLAAGPRPDPRQGVLETIRVADGAPVLLSAHLARLWASCEVLELPRQADLEARIRTAAATLADGALRVHVAAGVSQVRTRALPARPPVMTLEPVVLPGGLGEHKWADRALIDSLSSPERTPLFCDLDGAVLEAGYAAVMILNGTTLTAPPLDGRLLPSVAREQALAAARAAGLEVALESFGLQELRHADAVVLCSSLRGPHAGAMAGTAPAAAQRVCERLLRAAVDR